METAVDRTNASHSPSSLDDHTHKVKMIRKLRWIGREDEARQLERELRFTKGSDSVLATPRDTD
ncbi:hypothetical protein [Enterovirga sp. CN4-39]|uniref:hypothetical protein n=1 Tax=Enterovirga sp. CN4-39 TaxID=3400910 RepID=UPI003C073C74